MAAHRCIQHAPHGSQDLRNGRCKRCQAEAVKRYRQSCRDALRQLRQTEMA